MNTKALLAGTILSALFATTSAIAGDNSYLFEDATYETTTEAVIAKKVSLQSPAVETEYTFETSNK